MGLDMWVIKLSKIREQELEEKRYHGTCADKFSDILYLSEENFRENPEMYKDILPYATTLNLVESRMRSDLIKKDHGIPESAHAVHIGCSAYGINYDYVKGDVRYPTISLSNEEIERYTEYPSVPYYIAHEQELAYWRKNYSLQDRLYNLYEEHCRTRKLIVDYLMKRFEDNPADAVTYLMDEDNVAKMVVKAIPIFGVTGSDNTVVDICNQIVRNGLEFYMTDTPMSIENCGYHILNHDMAVACGMCDVYESLSDDEVLVYHEWY